MRIDGTTVAPLGFASDNYLIVRGKPKAPAVNGKEHWTRETTPDERRCWVTGADGSTVGLPIKREQLTPHERAERERREHAYRQEKMAELGRMNEATRKGDRALRDRFIERHDRDIIHTPDAIPAYPAPVHKGKAGPGRAWVETRPEFVGRLGIEEGQPMPRKLDAIVSVRHKPEPVKVGALTPEERQRILDDKVRLSAHERKRLQRLERTRRIADERAREDAKLFSVTR
jgi:hypothetical protein